MELVRYKGGYQEFEHEPEGRWVGDGRGAGRWGEEKGQEGEKEALGRWTSPVCTSAPIPSAMSVPHLTSEEPAPRDWK